MVTNKNVYVRSTLLGTVKENTTCCERRKKLIMTYACSVLRWLKLIGASSYQMRLPILGEVHWAVLGASSYQMRLPILGEVHWAVLGATSYQMRLPILGEVHWAVLGATSYQMRLPILGEVHWAVLGIYDSALFNKYPSRSNKNAEHDDNR